MSMVSLMLENLCLSTVNNEELIFITKVWKNIICHSIFYQFCNLLLISIPALMLHIRKMVKALRLCTLIHKKLNLFSTNSGLFFFKDWYRVCNLFKPNDQQWSLQTKAVLDRMQLALADKAQYYLKMIQPTAEYLGKLLRVETCAVCFQIYIVYLLSSCYELINAKFFKVCVFDFLIKLCLQKLLTMHFLMRNLTHLVWCDTWLCIVFWFSHYGSNGWNYDSSYCALMISKWCASCIFRMVPHVNQK